MSIAALSCGPHLQLTSRVNQRRDWQPELLPMSGRNSPPTPRLPQLRVHYQTWPTEEKSEQTTDNQVESATATAAPTRTRKRPRFLSDIDRSVIIQRLQQGAKQADLAREFGVTRAAISHINKNKHELLTRFDEFARTEHGRSLLQDYTRPSTDVESLIEVGTTAASVLLTRIRDRTTSAADFVASSRRLIQLLIEEALMSCGSAQLNTEVLPRADFPALVIECSPTAVAVGNDGLIMLEVFKDMEPESPTGWIKQAESVGNKETPWQVMSIDLPESIDQTPILLLIPELATASLIEASIDELRRRQVPSTSIAVVCVSCTVEAATNIHRRDPDVRVLTAHIDRGNQPLANRRLVSFTSRFFACQNELNE